MSKSLFRKKPNEKNLTRKMILEKMEEMSSLMVAMEATLMEWEIWFRLFKNMQEGMTQDEFHAYVIDGPIFTDIPGRIMNSIRNQMPEMEPPINESEQPPAILDSQGNVASTTDTRILTDANGKPIISKG